MTEAMAGIQVENTRLLHASESRAESPFNRGFTDALSRVAQSRVAHIQPEKVEQIAEEEGLSGHLPSPAKRVMFREIQAGQRPSPLRRHDETIDTGELERPVDMATLHVIAMISPLTVASIIDVEQLRNTLTAVAQLIAQGELVVRSDEDPVQVHIKQVQARVHLIQKSVVGDANRLTTHTMRAAGDLSSVLQAVSQGMYDVMQFHLKAQPNYQALTLDEASRRIAALREQDTGNKRIAIPLIVYPSVFPKGNTYNFHLVDNPSAVGNEVVAIGPKSDQPYVRKTDDSYDMLR